jgi:S-adenosylmethionine:tRNA ribosyltransferase-isomerase
VEILLLTPVSDSTWSALVKPARQIKVGSSITFPAGLEAEVTEEGEEGIRTLRFNLQGREFEEKLAQIGQIPLPPYIRRKLKDPDRYQTVYAQRPGAVAAPTAGLHFTPEVFKALEDKGIQQAYVTLHVGLGTFRPVSSEEVEEHKMHSEFYEVTPEAAQLINNAKTQGGRIVAVGTTSVRVLESASNDQGIISSGTGSTDIFIYPGYRFKAVDALITNFHLPKSSLIMLVSAFANREHILTAYQEAVQERYRFFSFGDAMLIL